MIGLLQRVSHASVSIEGKPVGAIEAGLMVLVGIQKTDGAAQAERLLERLLSYRVFPDAQGKMNLSLRDTGGSLLLVPQFTLAADTNSGTRASFTTAAEPALAKPCSRPWSQRQRHAIPSSAVGFLGRICR